MALVVSQFLEIYEPTDNIPFGLERTFKEVGFGFHLWKSTQWFNSSESSQKYGNNFKAKMAEFERRKTDELEEDLIRLREGAKLVYFRAAR